MSNFSVGNWLVIVGLACLAILPFAEAILKRLRKERETDREVLDRLAPRPPTPYVAASTAPPRPAPRPKPVSANRSSMSTKLRIVLTLLYVPGSVALYGFWSLVRPALRREVAQFNTASPELVAILWAAFATLVYFAILLPYFLIWRRGSGNKTTANSSAT